VGRKEVSMTVQDLYKVLFDEQEVEIKLKNGICLWYGKNEDIPIEYLEKIVNAVYSYDVYIVIEIA
jgi:hypothetical protein